MTNNNNFPNCVLWSIDSDSGKLDFLPLQHSEVLMIAGTAGMGYGLGRKYGRKACNFLDRVEDRIVSGMKTKVIVEE